MCYVFILVKQIILWIFLLFKGVKIRSDFSFLVFQKKLKYFYIFLVIVLIIFPLNFKFKS